MTKIANDQQLAYWLQGYFEIAGTEDLSEDQFTAIANVANKVEKQGTLSHFILDLAVNNGKADNGPALAKKLHEIFVHDIDPSYEGDQNQFNGLHNGGKPHRPPYGSGKRC